MIKLWKIIAGFIIFYFVITVSSSVIALANWISFGNLYIKYGFYGFMAILFILYIIIPLLDYYTRPSMISFIKMLNNDKKATIKIQKFFIKTLVGAEKESFKQLCRVNDSDAIRTWIKTYLNKEISEMDGIIKEYALKLTVGVLVSPNPFIDGIIILYGNSGMIHTLTQKVKIRYSLKELWNMYFSVMSVASISGLLEEFDDVIEDIFEDLADEFEEFIHEETGKTIGDSIPIFNILVKASSPIIQAAGNYAFILYNGNRYKYKLMNLISDTSMSDDEIRKYARKEARKAKYKYIEEMIKKIGLNGTDKIRKNFRKKNKEE